jgi:hypothetical protein
MKQIKVLTRTYKGGDVLQVESIDPMLGIGFLNWNVKPLRARDRMGLKGAGVYGVCYRGKLIYIGKYLGTSTDPFSGDVAAKRWWTHFASLTMRGHKLSFPRTTLNKLTCAQPPLDKSIQAALRSASPDISNDRGCLTSVNRALFANQNWHKFSRDEAQSVLADFSFEYARVDPDPPGMAIASLRKAISNAETTAIALLVPIANSEVPWSGKRVHVSCKKAATDITNTLCDSLRQALSLQEVLPDPRLQKIARDMAEGKVPPNVVKKMRAFLEKQNSNERG